MPSFGFTLIEKTATDSSLTITVETTSAGTEGVSLVISAETGGATAGSTTISSAAPGSSVDAIIAGLSASTTYTITATESGTQEADSITATTKASGYNDPKTATQEQWEDLTARIKAKSDVDITMTTTDPGEGATLAENNYIAVYGGDPIILDYSTSEINTGTYWIDGSVIYKKTINFGTLPNATVKNVAHGISNLGELVKYEGTVRNVTNIFLNINSPGVTSGYLRTIVDNTNIIVVTDVDRSGDTAYITLYYTKSS